MSPLVPNEIVDEILDKTDIVELLSSYVELKKSGQNFKARCPFHDEKTPSFMVSPAKQIFHCFGCGIGGNAISFLIKYEKMEFPEALKTLAEKSGVKLPEPRKMDPAKITFAEKLTETNARAAAFYQDNLNKKIGEEAYRYFRKRDVSEKTIKLFKLGYAQDSWNSLSYYFKSLGTGFELLSKAGLIVQNTEKGSWYEMFRNSVIFPIFGLRHKVIGFGARTLADTSPKYTNSPETFLYKKGSTLYGLNFSKEFIRKKDYVIIVEGYFDLLLPFQEDVKNIVATLGTALTPDQIRILKRFTKNAIMIYDADTAGEAATLRGLDILLSEGMNVRIATLPKGSDPDSFVRKEKKEGFLKLLKDSRDIFDYKIDILKNKFKSDTPGGKAKIANEMLPTISRLANEVLKSVYVKKLANVLLVDEEAIGSELKKVKKSFPYLYAPKNLSIAPQKIERASAAEITVLALLFDNPAFMEKLEKEVLINEFKNGLVVAILKHIKKQRDSKKEIAPSHVISHFDSSQEVENIVSEAIVAGESITDREKTFKDCIEWIKKNNQKFVLSSLQLQIKEAEVLKDSKEVGRLMVEYNTVLKEMQVKADVKKT